MQQAELFKQLRRIGWTASRRAVPRTQRIDTRDRQRAIDAFDRGDYELAVDILDGADLANDPSSLNLKAMAAFGAGLGADAVEVILDHAERASLRLLSGVQVNKAALFKTEKRYREAIDACEAALRWDRAWHAPHLVLIAVLEHRSADGDRARVAEAVRRMKTDHPDWRDSPALDDLKTDVDYRELRRAEGGALFERLFGQKPTNHAGDQA